MVCCNKSFWVDVRIHHLPRPLLGHPSNKIFILNIISTSWHLLKRGAASFMLFFDENIKKWPKDVKLIFSKSAIRSARILMAATPLFTLHLPFHLDNQLLLKPAIGKPQSTIDILSVTSIFLAQY